MKIHPTRAARPPGPPADAAVLVGLPQLGATIAARLAAVGLRTVGDLRRAGGPAAAYRRLRASAGL